MLVPPDPLIENEYNNFVHTSICSFGIHTHDKYTTGRCHKPPKGITRCALTKPSGLIDQTKPVQLIDLTSQQQNPSEKVIIVYQASEEIQSRKSAIDSLSLTNCVGPEFRENDPRLIVYEPKRSLLQFLPKQEDNATLQWIISKLFHAMMSNESESSQINCTSQDEKRSSTIPIQQSQDTKNKINHKLRASQTEREQILQVPKLAISTKRSHDINTDINWQWPMPEYLPTSYASVINPIGDGNCLLSALIMGMSQRNTNLDCSILRTQINIFLLNHPNKYVSQYIPRTVS